MDLKQIKNIIDLIAESDVDEVSIEEGEFKIKVKNRPRLNKKFHPRLYSIKHRNSRPNKPQRNRPHHSQRRAANPALRRMTHKKKFLAIRLNRPLSVLFTGLLLPMMIHL